MSLLTWFINPFGILDKTSGISERITQRTISVFTDTTDANSGVVAVTLSEAAISSISNFERYPVTLNLHSRILKTILCASPDSIYIDITFQSLRPDNLSGQTATEAAETLAAALSTTPASPDCRGIINLRDIPKERRNRKTPVYFARSAVDHSNCPDASAPSLWNGSCTILGIVTQSAATNVKELPLVRNSADAPYLDYPLFAVPENSIRFPSDQAAANFSVKSSGQTSFLSPALAQIVSHCELGAPEPHILRLCERALGAKNSESNSDLDSDVWHLVPTWRFYKHPIGDTSHCTNSQIAPENGITPFQRLNKWIWSLGDELYNPPEFLPDFPHFFENEYCTPYQNYEADSINEIANACIGSGNCDGEISSRFFGKSVVYGYTVDASNDLIESPVLGFVDGMLYHVAALDSLFVYGDKYLRVGTGIIPLNIPINDTTLPIIFLISAIFVLYLLNQMVLRNRIAGLNRTIVWIAVTFLIIVVQILVPYAMHLGPIDWFGITSLAYIFFQGQKQLASPPRITDEIVQ